MLAYINNIMLSKLLPGQQMSNYKKYFRRGIENNFPGRSADIITNTENHFKSILPDTNFSTTSSNPIDRRLNFSSYFLALIKTLDEEGETFENIRKSR